MDAGREDDGPVAWPKQACSVTRRILQKAKEEETMSIEWPVQQQAGSQNTTLRHMHAGPAVHTITSRI